MGMDLPEGDSYLEECAADQAKMTDLIRNERRIELCFENKRFWDLRRWLLPLNEPVRGMQIDCYSNGDIKYTVIPVVDERKFDNSFQCYGPIPKSEVLKWSNLKHITLTRSSQTMKEARQPTSLISSLCVPSYSEMISMTTRSTTLTSARYGQLWAVHTEVVTRMWKLPLTNHSATIFIS